MSPTKLRLNSKQVEIELKKLANPEKAAFFPRFFRTGPGEYGEGDKFIGVVVPDQRSIARKFKALPLKEIENLLDSPLHECRLTGLLTLKQHHTKMPRTMLRYSIEKFPKEVRARFLTGQF